MSNITTLDIYALNTKYPSQKRKKQNKQNKWKKLQRS